MDDGKNLRIPVPQLKILHALTGSVASTLVPKFKDSYEKSGHKVIFMATDSGMKFCHGLGFYPPGIAVDDMEWEEYRKRQTVLHIDLTKWADVLVFAPCSANTLAKLAYGLCDNLVTSCARAWDFEKRFVVAPAMNTKMWSHPVTKEHLEKLRSWGVHIVEPVAKKLYCGDTGVGALARVEDIIAQTVVDKDCPACYGSGYIMSGDPSYGTEGWLPCQFCK